MMRAGLLVLALLVQYPGMVSGQDRLIVGLRDDAPPFSFILPSPDGHSAVEELDIAFGGQVFSGYMVNVCASAIRGMQVDIEIEIVDPTTRFQLLQDGVIDVLCDPATISIDRLTENIAVSQPVYLSGIGMASQPSSAWSPAHWPCIGPVVGVVAGTTARGNVVGDLAKEGKFGPHFSQVVLKYPTPNEVALDEEDVDRLGRCAENAEQFGIVERLAEYADPSEAVAVRAFPNHTDLAKALCAGSVLVSVGDIEIIARSLQAAKDAVPTCEFLINPNVITVERYGIYVHIADGDAARQALVLRFLRQLAIEIHRGPASALIMSFRRNFNPQRIAPSLDVFFWNVIAGEPQR
ncbi:transporter substrate-binding domain-containing protein [Pararhodobacter sp. SW119]|uniref:transporter substrate-binding domain-containing protein n=1 Tax=Pararhodobacter sp. SW119 TaxID=2780075 RepID=UPI001ADFF428|nr:transporter substrate-binding domain-containing protein [Pararhodobacter sp. SW119]